MSIFLPFQVDVATLCFFFYFTTTFHNLLTKSLLVFFLSGYIFKQLFQLHYNYPNNNSIIQNIDTISIQTITYKIYQIIDPWEHVLFGIAGGVLGHQFGEYNKRNKADLLVLMGRMDKFGTAPAPEPAHEEDDE